MINKNHIYFVMLFCSLIMISCSKKKAGNNNGQPVPVLVPVDSAYGIFTTIYNADNPLYVTRTQNAGYAITYGNDSIHVTGVVYSMTGYFNGVDTVVSIHSTTLAADLKVNDSNIYQNNIAKNESEKLIFRNDSMFFMSNYSGGCNDYQQIGSFSGKIYHK